MSEENKGPFAYENWKMAMTDLPLQSVFEYPLFTDAYIVGQVQDECGPYQLLNTVPMPPDAQILAPAIVLRVKSFMDYQPGEMKKTDVNRYHGGVLSDEIAALVSMHLGIRLKAGGITRHFDPNGDPMGHPRGPVMRQTPTLDKTAFSPILPQALGMHSLAEIDQLKRLPDLLPQEAVALVRAARLYQDAMWIAESAPELSWIMFVSAVEIAASQWHTDQHDSLEILAEFKPELVDQLRAMGYQEAIAVVASEFSNHLRAAKKFREFIIEFLPEPPSKRPPEQHQCSWKPRDMKRAMVRIYEWRSLALHGGIPFPSPMCEPPRLGEEKPLGLATSTRGAVWRAEDTPMLLHTFEHIVRNALLKWWKSMLAKSEGAGYR